MPHRHPIYEPEPRPLKPVNWNTLLITLVLGITSWSLIAQIDAGKEIVGLKHDLTNYHEACERNEQELVRLSGRVQDIELRRQIRVP